MVPLIPAVIAPVFETINKILERLWPDPAERAKAELAVMQMQQAGEFRELELRMSAIVAEAQSADPWTSRARPSLFYVLYVMILASIPYGALYAIAPVHAAHVASGVQSWLAAIPSELWTVFGAGYLGYGAMRSYEKGKGVAK